MIVKGNNGDGSTNVIETSHQESVLYLNSWLRSIDSISSAKREHFPRIVVAARFISSEKPADMMTMEDI